MSRRITLFFVICGLLFTALVVRSVYLQVLPNQRLEAMNQRQFQKVLNIEGRRGFIYDRNGYEMAASVLAYSLYADPKLIKRPRSVARKLSKLLSIPFSKVYKKLSNKKRRFYWIHRRMDTDEKEKIQSWGIRGLGFIEEPKRVYPNEQLLANVLGFVGSSGQGLGGLEVKFESYLNGSGTSMKVQRDARGRPLFINGVLFNESPDGMNLHLTIDREIQYTLEKELGDAMAQFEAKAAWGVVLDVESSAVLAMANMPTYNPNKALAYSSSDRRNRSVTDPFETGSIMKVFTIASALQNKIAKPESKYFCENGRLKVGKRVIREADSRHKFKWLSVEDILAKSSNIGTTKIAWELGDAELRRGLLDFGFGSKTSNDFPGESRGILPSLPWNRHLLSNISFGHGVAVTPLQIASAMAAIGNGGLLNKPFIVNKITDSNERVVELREKSTERRVLSPEVADQMIQMLEKVLQKGGTGAQGRVPGYRVGGKTGTAQRIDFEHGGYEKGAYVSSFVGMLPLDRPKFVIMISVDQPETAYYASEVAAPVFSRVASFAVRHYGIEPSGGNTKIAPQVAKEKLSKKKAYIAKQKTALDKLQKLESREKWTKVPKMEGLSLREVMRKLRPQGLSSEIYGSGRLSKTYPEQGEALPRNGKLKLYFK